MGGVVRAWRTSFHRPEVRLNGQKVSSKSKVLTIRWTSVLSADRMRPSRFANITTRLEDADAAVGGVQLHLASPKITCQAHRHWALLVLEITTRGCETLRSRKLHPSLPFSHAIWNRLPLAGGSICYPNVGM